MRTVGVVGRRRSSQSKGGREHRAGRFAWGWEGLEGLRGVGKGLHVGLCVALVRWGLLLVVDVACDRNTLAHMQCEVVVQ